MSMPDSKSAQNGNNSTSNNYNKGKNDNNNNNNKEGLPDIAESKHNHVLLLVIITISLFAFLIIWWFHLHPSVSKTTKTDETFSVDNDVPSLTLPALTQIQKQNLEKALANVNNPPSPPVNTDEQKEIMIRLEAPLMVVGQNSSYASNFTNELDSTKNTTNSFSSNNKASSNDPNTNFLNQISNEDVDTINASLLQNRETLITQGTLIHAILEPPINSDLPGYLRAIVSKPVYSDDGTQVLIARGSRLIGQYKSGILAGQSRIFTVWTRVIEPNGISIQLGSPGVDSIGVSGIGADSIDHHFWQMFGTATLLSILNAGTSNIGENSGDEYNASQEYREAISQSLAQASNNSLEQYGNIPPTLNINQGKPIIVFVAKDLRFDTAMQETHSSVSIF